MGKKDSTIFLKHIFESIVAIEKYVAGVSETDFLKDQKTQDSVIRRLEIIGEATTNISEEFKKKHPQVPWGKIIGTRNVLIHEYFGVEVELVWGILQSHLPELKKAIQKILADK